MLSQVSDEDLKDPILWRARLLNSTKSDQPAAPHGYQSWQQALCVAGPVILGEESWRSLHDDTRERSEHLQAYAKAHNAESNQATRHAEKLIHTKVIHTLDARIEPPRQLIKSSLIAALVLGEVTAIKQTQDGRIERLRPEFWENVDSSFAGRIYERTNVLASSYKSGPHTSNASEVFIQCDTLHVYLDRLRRSAEATKNQQVDSTQTVSPRPRNGDGDARLRKKHLTVLCAVHRLWPNPEDRPATAEQMYRDLANDPDVLYDRPATIKKICLGTHKASKRLGLPKLAEFDAKLVGE